MKIASVKKAKPSSEKGMPIIAPAFPMKAGPEQAELEGQHGAGDRSHREKNRGAPGPSFAELQINRLPGAQIGSLRHDHEQRHPDPQGGEHDMEGQRHRHLRAGEEKIIHLVCLNPRRSLHCFWLGRRAVGAAPLRGMRLYAAPGQKQRNPPANSLPQASLLAPHRPMAGMLVARASPAPKTLAANVIVFMLIRDQSSTNSGAVCYRHWAAGPGSAFLRRRPGRNNSCLPSAGHLSRRK